jgi:hypothetical protein
MHAVLAAAWLAFAPLAMLTSLRHSVPLLVGISVYANVAGHWSAAQAAHAEEHDTAFR